MGRLNATTGTFIEYPVPLPSLAAPAVIRVQQGNYLYFTAAAGNAIGRIDIRNGKMKAFPSPVLADLPGTDIEDSKGNVWYSSLSQNTISKLNPTTGSTSVVRIPGATLPILTVSVTYLKSQNAIYFTQDTNNTVGRYQLY